MLAYTYIEKGKFALVEKPKPTLIEPTDAIVRVTMASVGSINVGFGFSTKANFPFSMYVYASIII